MKVVVIGNGVAGEAACSAIRAKNQKVNITLISEEPYPFYSPSILTQYISKEIKRSKVFLKSLKDYKREGIHTMLGYRVERIDPFGKRVFLSGREISYDKLILAMGSRPIIPPIEGIEKKGVRVFKSLTDAERLNRTQVKRVMIIGSGPIGVELAIALRKRGCDVYLIEVLDWILPNLFDEKGSLRMRRILENQGIGVFTGERVLAIEGKIAVREVMTQRTGGHKVSMVIFAVGMWPSVELAKNAGIEVGELGGILTNEEMETNIKDIYACGDCVEGRDPFTLRPKLSFLWPHAERQGTVAGYNSIGEHRSLRWMPDVINLNIFGTFAGAMGQPARTIKDGEVKRVEVEEKERYFCLVISEGRLVGVQFIGDYEGGGTLLPFLGRNYGELYQKIKDEGNIAQYPWYFPARNFFLNEQEAL